MKFILKMKCWVWLRLHYSASRLAE